MKKNKDTYFHQEAGMYFLYFVRRREIIEGQEQNIKPVMTRHLIWVERGILKKKILQAGTLGDVGGIMIFKAENIDEAKKFIQQDPLSTLIDYEIHEFYPQIPLE